MKVRRVGDAFGRGEIDCVLLPAAVAPGHKLGYLLQLVFLGCMKQDVFSVGHQLPHDPPPQFAHSLHLLVVLIELGIGQEIKRVVVLHALEDLQEVVN